MTISATSTGVLIAGPENPISSILITDPDGNESTLNMGLVNSRGMDNIIAGTLYDLELLGFGAFGGISAFVDPNAVAVELIKNNVTINAGYNAAFGLVQVSGVLYQNRDGLIKVQLDNGATDPSELSDIRFGLFDLGADTLLLSADLNSGITTDNELIYITLPAIDLIMVGSFYLELVINNGATNQLISCYIKIVDSRLP
jgi:hypothetical protein